MTDEPPRPSTSRTSSDGGSDGGCPERRRVRRAMLDRLARRAFSRAELIERTLARGFDAALVADVADEIERAGWLDDPAFARDAAQHLVRRAPAGRDLVAARLVARGVDDTLAETTARDAVTDPTADAEAMARRLLGRSDPSDLRTARRIGAALGRRGFDEDTILTALSRVGIRVDDDGSDVPPDDDFG